MMTLLTVISYLVLGFLVLAVLAYMDPHDPHSEKDEIACVSFFLVLIWPILVPYLVAEIFARLGRKHR